MTFKLVDECQYSLSDLFDKVKWNIILVDLSQSLINDLVKKACDKINWHWEDRIGTDGVVYTAFSPYIELN